MGNKHPLPPRFSSQTNSSAELKVKHRARGEVESPRPLPEKLLARRGGVSAEATGAHNRRYAVWESPIFEKSPHQHDLLIRTWGQCPFLAGASNASLAALADASYIKEFSAGECLHEQREVGRTGYVLLSGHVKIVHLQSSDNDRASRNSGTQISTFHGACAVTMTTLAPGRFFGEHTMLWGFRRESSAYAQEDCVVGKIKRDVFYNLVTRRAMKERSLAESYLRKIPMFETLSDEQISGCADVIRYLRFSATEPIIRQGDPGNEVYIMMSGECVATIATGEDDIQEHRRYYPGDRFGELAFLKEKSRRGATISAVSDVEVCMLKCMSFKRLFGAIGLVQQEQYMLDPRKSIADFYRPGNRDGPRGVCAPDDRGETQWFAVYRPTSRDAISKMLMRVAVGKGLNVKGKSSKKNHLSGFVPFLQISNNEHKDLIEQTPEGARMKIFYQSDEARKLALQNLSSYCASDEIREDNRFDKAGQFGLNVPELAVREAYIMDSDISFLMGWATGRASEPAFMDMNLHCVRGGSTPEVVLYQYDKDHYMNPHGLLIAYAESSVKPVVSDFDTFTVGSKGMSYESLPPTQCELATWSLNKTLEILQNPGSLAWNSRWLEILHQADAEGFHPEVPRYGFGDATSYRLIEAVVQATLDSGAVRHGAECFNFYFPQEMDPEYLVVWEKYSDQKPWQYVSPAELQKFLLARIEEGFRFPLNPVWAVRDKGWYAVYEKLKVASNGSDAAVTFKSWFPPTSGLAEKIETIHRQFPNGFQTLEEVEQAQAAENDQIERDSSWKVSGHTGRTYFRTVFEGSCGMALQKIRETLHHQHHRKNKKAERLEAHGGNGFQADDGGEDMDMLDHDEDGALIDYAASTKPGTRKSVTLAASAVASLRKKGNGVAFEAAHHRMSNTPTSHGRVIVQGTTCEIVLDSSSSSSEEDSMDELPRPRKQSLTVKRESGSASIQC